MLVSVQDEVETEAPRPGCLALVQLIHDALRRDLDRLARAVRTPQTTPWRASRLGDHWQFVSKQIRDHDEIEDFSLWPMARWRLREGSGDAAVFDKMEAQHEDLKPACAAVDEAFRLYSYFPNRMAGADLAARLENLRADLGSHLDEEESESFPILARALSTGDFHLFGKALAKSVGIRQSAMFLPWVLEGASPAERDSVLAALPGLVRLIYRWSWEPRYRRQAGSLWGQ